MNIWILSSEKEINLNHQVLVFIVMITFSFTANAEQVYESTDDEGVVEFSDKPSSDDAQVIDVEEPNTANSVSSESIKSSTPASATKTKAEQTPEQLEAIRQGTVDGDDNRREMRKERKEQKVEHREKVVRQPIDSKPIRSQPVHKGVHGK